MDNDYSRAQTDAIFQEALQLSSEGKYEEASNGMLEVLLWRKENLGIDDHDTLEAMHAVAYISNVLENYSEALELYEKLYELRKSKLGERHRDSLMTLHNVAFTYEKLGEYSRAAELFREVLKLREETVGYEDIETLQTADCLIHVYSSMKDGASEIALRERLYEIKLASKGRVYFDPLEELYDITEACNKYLYTLKARTYAKECFLLHINELGISHKRTLKTLDMLSLAYVRLNEYKRSCALDRVKYKALAEKYGENDERPLRVLDEQAYTYFNFGDYRKAKDVYESLCERMYGVEDPDPPFVASSEYYLARTYDALGERAKAKEMMERSLRGMSDYYGEDHPDTLSIKEELDNMK